MEFRTFDILHFMGNLQFINVILPKKDGVFFEKLTYFLTNVCEVNNSNTLNFHVTNSDFVPVIQLKEEKVDLPLAKFISNENEILKTIELRNITGEKVKSPHQYSKLDINEIIKRLKKSFPSAVDHLGINLPWFQNGVHPEIEKLRIILKDKCLYHLFPSGENWDFIIPGTESEIIQKEQVDYSKIRKPKFEIVSFEKDSTPLLQIDLGLPVSYEKLVEKFPEGLNSPEYKNIWVYVTNPYGIDVCLVLNEHKGTDWSEFFQATRFL